MTEDTATPIAAPNYSEIIPDQAAPIDPRELALRDAIEIRENSMAGDLTSLLIEEFKAASNSSI